MSPSDRRNSKYGFESLNSMTEFFSRWISDTEIQNLIQQAETTFRPRLETSPTENHLQKIQKAEFAIVRKLVQRNSTIP